MNRVVKNICLLFPILLGLTGCEQLDVQRYENDPRLYFFKGNYNLGEFVQRDSVNHSFYVLPDSKIRDTVWVELRTMGSLSAEARSFKVIQTNEGKPGAAVPGVHYVGFDDLSIQQSMKIPAHAWRYQMPVVLLRDRSLERTTVSIRMAVAVNENFGVGLDTLSNFLVTTSAVVSKPLTWDSGPGWGAAFGEWGIKKMWFVMNYVGITDFEDVSGLKDFGYASYLKTYAQDKLDEYNADERNKDRPLREADNTEVEF